MPSWLQLFTILSSLLLSAGCVVACSRLASRCIHAAKRRSTSDSTLARLETDQAELSSSLASLAKTVKRLSSRYGMQEHRSGLAATDVPPTGTPKSELRRHYGLAGKTASQIASDQLKIVRSE